MSDNEAKAKEVKAKDDELKTEKPAEEKKEEKTTTAKAGKRSAKAVKETEEKQAKEERKRQTAETSPEEKKKPTAKPARSRTERAGKKYREAAKLIDKTKTYELKEALELTVKTSLVKFDATVELHINLSVDPRQADQNVRDSVVLPSGSGKTMKVAVLAEAEDAIKATKAGADIAGSDNIFADLDKENISFDVLIATPSMMQKLSKYARLLGPRGLMPNPKSGTVTPDVAKAVTEAKAGKVEFRVDSNGILHVGIGKVSFGADKLLLNAEALLSSVRQAKPASIKSNYIKAMYVTTSMGPSVRLQI
jgi:large subunit ribosomal protein L1